MPKSDIRDEVNRYVSDLFRGHFIVGIQLRFTYIDDPQDTQTLLKCAQEIEANFTKTNGNDKKVKWFVTSDRKDVLDRLSLEYPDKVVVSQGQVGHIEQDSSAYRRTILDVELLTKCDVLVLTGGSTFGFVAAMKQLKMPFYVNGRMNMNKCERMSLGAPSLTHAKVAVFR